MTKKKENKRRSSNGNISIQQNNQLCQLTFLNLSDLTATWCELTNLKLQVQTNIIFTFRF